MMAKESDKKSVPHEADAFGPLRKEITRRAVQDLLMRTMWVFVDSKNLPEELQFDAGMVFVTT